MLFLLLPLLYPRLVILQSPNRLFLIRVSYLEIYNETIRDLLAEGAPTLAVHEDKKRVRDSR